MEVPLGLVTDIGEEARDKAYNYRVHTFPGLDYSRIVESLSFWMSFCVHLEISKQILKLTRSWLLCMIAIMITAVGFSTMHKKCMKIYK